MNIMAPDALHAYPIASKEYLKSILVGKSLSDVPTPAAVVDRARARQNCSLMLEAVKTLGVSFRAHVKTHKTTELTQMQVGEDCKDVRLIVSTVIEAEHLVPLLVDYQSNGAKVNVLYGVPPAPAQIDRFASMAKLLGPGSLSVMIDSPVQLSCLQKFKGITGFPVAIFIKVDSGTHRAGIEPHAGAMTQLVKAVLDLETSNEVTLLGFYSHAGHSYAGNSPSDAMDMLQHEVAVCQEAAQHISPESRRGKPALTISVGASPTALSIQNLTTASNPDSSQSAQSLKTLLDAFTHPATSVTDNKPKPQQFALELHAGVYPLLDLQQLAAHSRASSSINSVNTGSTTGSTTNPIALTILTTIHSLYPYPSRPTPQALIAAGCLALGREPCKSYTGWGVLSAWNITSPPTRPRQLQPATHSPSTTPPPLTTISSTTSTATTIHPSSPTLVHDDDDATTTIIVDRISQEHGILTWADTSCTADLPLQYGQQVRIYPNHACIASAMFDWYVVVDSDSEDENVVRDVWIRWRGW